MALQPEDESKLDPLPNIANVYPTSFGGGYVNGTIQTMSGASFTTNYSFEDTDKGHDDLLLDIKDLLKESKTSSKK